MTYVEVAAASPPRDIAWLLDTTNRMVGCRNLMSLLDLAYDAVRFGLGYDRVGLMMVDTEREWLWCSLGTDEIGNKTFLDERMISLDDDPFYSRLLQDPRMRAGGEGFILLEGAELKATFKDRPYLDGYPEQNLLVALRAVGGIAGLISVDNLMSGRSIIAADAPALVAFANTLAAMLDNVALLESRARRITDLDADVRVRVEHLSWLQEASGRLATLQDLDAVLDAIYTSVRWGLAYDRVGIFLRAENTDPPAFVERRGTDEQGEATLGLDNATPLDHEVALHSPDIDHLLKGHAFYFVEDRWAAMPESYRHTLRARIREQMVVALRHDGELVGFVSVDNLLSNRAFTAGDATPLVAFASQAALAVSRAHLWAEHAAQSKHLALQVRQLEWLRDMSRKVNAGRTLDAVLDQVQSGILTGLHYDRVGIWLSNESGTQLEELRGADVDGMVTGPRDQVIALTGDASVERIPGLMPLVHGEVASYLLEAADTPPDAPHLLKGPATQKLLVALRSSEAVTGIIVVDNAVSHQPIMAEHAGVLLALAGQVGTAIQNVRLQERERVERARLSVLVDAAHALSSTLDSNEILRELAARLVVGLRAANVAFDYTNAADRTCVMAAQQMAPGRVLLTVENPETIFDRYPAIARVVTEGKPFFGTFYVEDLPEGEREFLLEHMLLAELIVPICLRGETIGLLRVYWDRIGTVGAETVTLCTAIAEQVAMALGNARLYADASQRADLDALTGLYNHSALLARIDHAVEEAASFSLVLLDVDNFKLFNDTYGHLIGNAVLTSITNTIREMCRDGDTGGRYGGDELAILLPSSTRAEARLVVQRLMDTIKVRPHVTSGGSVIPISVSAGIACFPEDGHTRQELVAVADAAMYVAKRRSSVKTRSNPISGVVPQWSDAHLRDAADLLGDSPFGVLEGLVSAVDAKDRYTREHSEHVTHLALLLLDALGLPAEQRRVITIAGLLHDVGKIGVPDRILRKPGSLSGEEYDAIKRHVSYGVAIIRGVLDDKNVVDAVAFHHERWDGRGYPHALVGPATPLLARIMQVADAASSMLLDRPYRKGLAWEHVVAQLHVGRGAQFDPDLVDPFVRAYDAFRAHLK